MDYIAVHTIDGRSVLINRKAIVTIGGPRSGDKAQQMLTGDATCLVTLSDGKFVTVVESCDEIRRRLELLEAPAKERRP
jgi:uncharacterized protein YlzI (FlbEa/FlbD family)